MAAAVPMDTDCCSICYENFEGRRKATACCYCSVKTCGECVKMYVLQSFQDPHCHSCKRGWSDEFMSTLFPKTVINSVFKKHRQATWLERQRALLPARQALVEEERRIRKYDAVLKELAGPHKELTDKLIACNMNESDCHTTLNFLTHYKNFSKCATGQQAKCQWEPTAHESVLRCSKCNMFSCVTCGVESFFFRDGNRTFPHACLGSPVNESNIAGAIARMQAESVRFKEISRQIRAERSEISTKMDEAKYMKHGPRALLPESEAKKPKASFVRACPSGDCRGFLSSAWKCGTCEGWACSNCHEYIGKDKNKTEHVCHPDQVASARLLDKETKPCPKCASAIFKISGCFAANTPILMWDGSVKMSQDILKGDTLVGDDGLPRTVLRTLRGQDDMYAVEQSDGVPYTVNQYHTLALKDDKNQVVEMTVKEFFNSQQHLSGFKSTAGIHYDNDELAKDPYALGVRITNQVSTYIIPDAYMRGSRDTRLKVLAGLVDMYGYASNREVTFGLLGPSMAQQVALLARSLGFVVTVSSSSSCIVKMSGSKLYELPTRHAIGTSTEVVTLSKLTVTPLGTGSYYGWEVDANHRFLLPDFTVVRNCDQMWCTACNTGFNWRDGKAIDTRAIHNPHFFEYMSRNNMQQQTAEGVNMMCMDEHLPPVHSVVQACVRARATEIVQAGVARALRFLLHVQATCMRRYQRLAGRDSVKSEEELAVLYLLNDIGEKEWMERLQRTEKRQRKYRMFADIFESYVAACTDVFRGMIGFRFNAQPAQITPEQALTHCTELWNIASAAMQGVCKLYDCKMPPIDFDEQGVLYLF